MSPRESTCACHTGSTNTSAKRCWYPVMCWVMSRNTVATECHYCTANFPGSSWGPKGDEVVPGVKQPFDHKRDCHCGHPPSVHSFHCAFCNRCNCYSMHFAGETYDDIHDRWN